MRRRTWREWDAMYQAWKRVYPFMVGNPLRLRYVNQCRNKLVYDSQDEANKAMVGHATKPGCVLNAYTCQMCGELHIGNRKLAGGMMYDAAGRSLDPMHKPVPEGGL